MAEGILVRPAGERDIPDITRIYNDAVLRSTATFDMEPKTPEDRLQWFAGHSEACPLLVATIEGKVVGWGDIHPFGDRRAYRHTVENAVYVDCDYRGLGVGAALLARLVETAQKTGYHAMLALIVDGNDASEHLHQRFGFERLGVMREVGRKFGQWLDLLVYEKLLEGPADPDE